MMPHQLPTLTSHKIFGLYGTSGAFQGLPGDKSISHRCLIFASLAEGQTKIMGLNNGHDVNQTKTALENMGVRISHTADHGLLVHGLGQNRLLKQPATPIYLGNSGTSARLLCGLVASQDMQVTFYGDSSLSQRPMQRVIAPLKLMGAQFETETEHSLPLHVIGTKNIKNIQYTMPVPSAQVKTALLIAGMAGSGTMEIIEPTITRDHTERLLQYLDYPIHTEISAVIGADQAQIIRLEGKKPLFAKPLTIPADTSAAAFLTVAALITPRSHIKLEGICWNPFRNVIFRVLQTMGAAITVSNIRDVCGEPIADLDVQSSTLHPIEIDAASATPLIDEYPILAIAAATAAGTSEFHGLSELRYKESNRLQAIADGLMTCGIHAYIQGDSLKINGQKTVFGGATIQANRDHRIAAAFYILGMMSQNPIMIYGAETIKTSFPDFLKIIERLQRS